MSRILVFVLIFMVTSGCMPKGRVVDASGLKYSEYFQCLIYSEDNRLSFDAFIILGEERLPSAYRLTPAQKKFLASSDTIVSVNEVYIRNHSGATIQLSQLVVGEGVGSFSRYYQPEIIELAPGEVVLSKPIIDVASVYGPSEFPCNITYKMQGKPYVLRGKWKRILVDDLNR
ncbi:hypothetical protein ACJJIK_00115 [Microbulbifer sp. ZKSA006]|uniref:hypothetical protein n=1 Tax=Microbulbifer sp. ZKSA006 TaxID=3243390 RepID=UPI00403A3C4C